MSRTAFFVSGISAGTTNVFALDADDNLIMNYKVRVVADSTEATDVLTATAPAGNLRVRDAGGVAIIRGSAKSVGEAIGALEAERALTTSGRQAANQTTIAKPVQVSLRVRFAEVSRDDLFELGVDLSAVFADGGNTALTVFANTDIDEVLGRAALGRSTSDVNFDAVLDALERVGVVQILSEPTLTTVSGKRARFRAGGEVAFPINQGEGRTTAEFRDTGVTVEFLPTVLPNNRIAIEVKPEVSFIDRANGTAIEGFDVPGFSVRSAETTVEVASGQTFAIAGLYEKYSTDTSSGLPGIRTTPLLGDVTSKRRQERRERELIIFITPLIVDASDAAARAQTRKVPVSERIGFILK